MMKIEYSTCRKLLIVLRLLATAFFGAAFIAGCAAPRSARLAASLDEAGENRHELERVLDHYAARGATQELKAAEFLIENMRGHGYSVGAFYDTNKNEVAFDALEYSDYDEARAALDELEKEHGELAAERKRFDTDIETITADFLIENIDFAFKAWQSKPWATNLSFAAFCEYVLPYRGSNEPLNVWRKACFVRYIGLEDDMKPPNDAREAARVIKDDVNKWVGFKSIFYLHPTDQGFDEMNDRRLGRCEDISNMMTYALRANCIAAVADYTPHWANRDNNHAWEVILDDHGRGNAKLFARAAKIYRKTFSIQREGMGALKKDDEDAPRWFTGEHYIDVTDQYYDTTNLTVSLEKPGPPGTLVAYICVFNGGEWKAVDWARIKDGSVTFTDLTDDIAYLPGYFTDGKIAPAGPAFILTKDGDVAILDGVPAADEKVTIHVSATKPTHKDDDTRQEIPMSELKEGKTYEMFYWDDEWVAVGEKEAGSDLLSFSAPRDRLYWVVEKDSKRLERIFTVESGRQVWW